MTQFHHWVNESLHQLDERLFDHIPIPKSLSHEKRTITSFVEMGKNLIPSNANQQIIRCALDGLKQILDAQIKNFPDNIFWDFDYLFFKIISCKTTEYCDEYCQLIVELQENFGIHSPIKFQYMHDFTYGFDWAKWVKKDPQQRKNIKPFDKEFLLSVKARKKELLLLIKNNDPKYPPLKTPTPRNPFNFNINQQAEELLHQKLSELDLIPVRAWNPNLPVFWDRDFNKIREEISLKENL